jgi:hypothetical protein
MPAKNLFGEIFNKGIFCLLMCLVLFSGGKRVFSDEFASSDKQGRPYVHIYETYDDCKGAVQKHWDLDDEIDALAEQLRTAVDPERSDIKKQIDEKTEERSAVEDEIHDCVQSAIEGKRPVPASETPPGTTLFGGVEKTGYPEGPASSEKPLEPFDLHADKDQPPESQKPEPPEKGTPQTLKPFNLKIEKTGAPIILKPDQAKFDSLPKTQEPPHGEDVHGELLNKNVKGKLLPTKPPKGLKAVQETLPPATKPPATKKPGKGQGTAQMHEETNVKAELKVPDRWRTGPGPYSKVDPLSDGISDGISEGAKDLGEALEKYKEAGGLILQGDYEGAEKALNLDRNKTVTQYNLEERVKRWEEMKKGSPPMDDPFARYKYGKTMGKELFQIMQDVMPGKVGKVHMPPIPPDLPKDSGGN